jgi:hypothetical protein
MMTPSVSPQPTRWQWRRQPGHRRAHLYRVGVRPLPTTPVCLARINYARTEQAPEQAWRGPDACYECLAGGVSAMLGEQSKKESLS